MRYIFLLALAACGFDYNGEPVTESIKSSVGESISNVELTSSINVKACSDYTVSVSDYLTRSAKAVSNGTVSGIYYNFSDETYRWLGSDKIVDDCISLKIKNARKDHINDAERSLTQASKDGAGK